MIQLGFGKNQITAVRNIFHHNLIMEIFFILDISYIKNIVKKYEIIL